MDDEATSGCSAGAKRARLVDVISTPELDELCCELLGLGLRFAGGIFRLSGSGGRGGILRLSGSGILRLSGSGSGTSAAAVSFESFWGLSGEQGEVLRPFLADSRDFDTSSRERMRGCFGFASRRFWFDFAKRMMPPPALAFASRMPTLPAADLAAVRMLPLRKAFVPEAGRWRGRAWR